MEILQFVWDPSSGVYNFGKFAIYYYSLIDVSIYLRFLHNANYIQKKGLSMEKLVPFLFIQF